MTDGDKEAVLEQLEAQAVAMDADVEELGIVKKTEYQETQDEIEELRDENEDLEAEMEELQDEVSIVKDAYAEELSDATGFGKETLSEKFELEELREKFEEEFESVEALTGNKPEPKSGDKGDEEELGQGDRERIEELEEKRDAYEQMGWESNVEAVDQELAELRGE